MEAPRIGSSIGAACAAMAMATVSCGSDPGSFAEHVDEETQAVVLTPPANGAAAFVRSTYFSRRDGYPSDPNTSYSSFPTWPSLSRGDVGRYVIDFPEFYTPIFPNIQVMAFGGGSVRCKAASWYISESLDPTIPPVAEYTLHALVSCFTVWGTPADSLFTAQFTKRDDKPGNEAAYAYADRPSAASYTIDSSYSWNSNGDPMSVTHAVGTGSYSVLLTGQDLTHGTVEVTAAGDSTSYCKLAGWAGSTANVNCYDGARGTPVESTFTLLYSKKSPNNIPSFTYLYADQPTAATYNPVTTREHGAVAGCGTLLTQPNATITRTSAGHYTAKLPGMGDYQQSPSTVNVTAAGTGNESCSVAAWHVASTDPLSFVYADAYVDVVCINASGTPVDARYTLTYSSFATLCA